jgi:hypothetical protein
MMILVGNEIKDVRKRNPFFLAKINYNFLECASLLISDILKEMLCMCQSSKY